MTAHILHKRFNVSQYYRMGETGILTDQDRVELIQGEILEMSPIGAGHAACVNRLARILFTVLSDQVTISIQNPVRLSDYSEPQPDVAILHEPTETYERKHPEPQDILALIEVSDSTLEYDRTRKAPLYAREQVRELWIVDLNAGGVEVYRSPHPDGYQQIQVFRPGQSVAFEAFPEIPIAIAQILPA